MEFAQRCGRFDLLVMLFVNDFFWVVWCVFGLVPLRNSVREVFWYDVYELCCMIIYNGIDEKLCNVRDSRA